jgi:hypothetical protein
LRLWSIHPKYLDAIGLVALWRESLLAQKVLAGKTRGYKNHPQLARFKRHPFPQRAIAVYLEGIWRESKNRGYHLDKRKIGEGRTRRKMPVTWGQLVYEFKLLKHKLTQRAHAEFREMDSVEKIECHPSFTEVPGEAEEWEKVKDNLLK